MTPADIFATIGIIVILVLYIVIMSFFGLGESISGKSVDSEIISSNSMNLYSYLESPVNDERMIDVLREYADEEFSDTLLRESVISESERILNKLNFCAENKAYFNIVVIDYGNDNNIEIFNPKWAEGLYEMGLQFDELALVQRVPYDDGIFYVKYYNSYLEEGSVERDCKEVLSYE